jgi:very-short-patch-repair endonuclease
MTPKRDLEGEFAGVMHMLGVPEPARQYKFHKPRKWPMDFAWVDAKLAVEIDGETAHARWHQITRDAKKRNQAVLDGWRVLVFTGSMVDQDAAGCVDVVKAALGKE